MRAHGNTLHDFLIELRTSGRTWAGGLQSRFARATQREKMLLVALAAGALIYAPIGASGWRADQQARYTEAQIERNTARLAAAAARRVQQTSRDEAALRDMATWGFSGTNLDVIRVRLEQRLVQAAADAELQNLQVQFSEDAEAYGPTRWIRADVDATLKWGPAFAFLDSLAGWPEGFRVVGLAYEGYTRPVPVQDGAEPTPPPAVTVNRPAKLRLALAFPIADSVPVANASGASEP